MNEFVSAYVLINTKTRDVDAVRDRLNSIPSVVLTHSLIGPSALICYVECKGLSGLQKCVDNDIRGLIDEGLVASTETMLVLMQAGRGHARTQNNPPPGSAWIFANSQDGDVTKAVETLSKTPGVDNVHAVIGRYDLVIYVAQDNWHELMDVLDNTIRPLSVVASTDTRIVFMRRAKKRA